MEGEKTLRDEVETVSEFTYLGDRVRAGEGCEAVEAVVTAITILWWVEFWECSELL